MKLWPYEAFELETTLTPDEIVRVLHDHIEPRKFFEVLPPGDTDKPLEGSIGAEGFKCVRTTSRRNSFRPTVIGRFGPGRQGIRVSIRLRMQPVVSAFMAFWFGGVVWMIIRGVMRLIQEIDASWANIGGPLAFMLFGWAFLTAVFHYGVQDVKPILMQMFPEAGETKTDEGHAANRRPHEPFQRTRASPSPRGGAHSGRRALDGV